MFIMNQSKMGDVVRDDLRATARCIKSRSSAFRCPDLYCLV